MFMIIVALLIVVGLAVMVLAGAAEEMTNTPITGSYSDYYIDEDGVLCYIKHINTQA